MENLKVAVFEHGSIKELAQILSYYTSYDVALTF